MDRSILVIEAMKKAKAEQDKNTIIKEYQKGVKSTTRYIWRNGAVWYISNTGCIHDECRVYKLNTERPYIRSFGRYFYLSGKDYEIAKKIYLQHLS